MTNKARYILFSTLYLALSLSINAQQIEATRQNDLDMTGAPIFSHGCYYTGMVEDHGEMIPSFAYSDFYVFKKLVFKNAREARNYLERCISRQATRIVKIENMILEI